MDAAFSTPNHEMLRRRTGSHSVQPDQEVGAPVPLRVVDVRSQPADAPERDARAEPWSVVPRERSEVASRCLNVVVACVALLLLAPVMLLVALLVKLTSRGPVLYTQTRVGLDRRWYRTQAMYDRRTQDLGGCVFTIYKFRSMTVNAEQDGTAVWATKNDARVTPLGRVLRKTRLDELPQLFNVLRGDMNIVGPRPERPSIFVRLRTDIPGYPLRQRARPGITGWAQINQSYDSCIADVKKKVAFDLEYIGRQSLWEDVKIMAKTIPVMVFRKGGW